MMRILRYGLLCCCSWLLFACDRAAVDTIATSNSLSLNNTLGAQAEASFSRAIMPRQFTFPQDHYSHPDFRNEWWYITGNVSTPTGQQFGYQVTLFRNALVPTTVNTNDLSTPTSRSWRAQNVWMAHVALTDITAQRHYYQQRFARQAVGLAGQQNTPFKVWVEDWQITAPHAGEFPWEVQVKTADFQLNLALNASKPVILQGKQGLSQKSAEKGNASYYYSMTRLATTGSIQVGESVWQVSGDSWLDREWSTSALGKDQAGWDWFSLQLDNQYELMFYRMRLTSGETDRYSAGKWVLPNGEAQSLSAEDVTLVPLHYWQSPLGYRYPVQWRLSIARLGIDWLVTAALDAQAMPTLIHYWEGAVKITPMDGDQVIGRGYLEMTGY